MLLGLKLWSESGTIMFGLVASGRDENVKINEWEVEVFAIFVSHVVLVFLTGALTDSDPKASILTS